MAESTYFPFFRKKAVRKFDWLNLPNIPLKPNSAKTENDLKDFLLVIFGWFVHVKTK